jgi:hypothetical protein
MKKEQPKHRQIPLRNHEAGARYVRGDKDVKYKDSLRNRTSAIFQMKIAFPWKYCWRFEYENCRNESFFQNKNHHILYHVPVCFVTGKGTGASALGLISQIAVNFSLTVKFQHPSFITS